MGSSRLPTLHALHVGRATAPRSVHHRVLCVPAGVRMPEIMASWVAVLLPVVLVVNLVSHALIFGPLAIPCAGSVTLMYLLCSVLCVMTMLAGTTRLSTCPQHYCWYRVSVVPRHTLSSASPRALCRLAVRLHVRQLHHGDAVVPPVRGVLHLSERWVLPIAH